MAALTASINGNSLPLSAAKLVSPPLPTMKAGVIDTIDDLLLDRVRCIPDAPLVAYPSSSHGKNDYVNYTAKDLDRFADEAARKYTKLGLVPRFDLGNSEVVSILAPSSLDYIVSVLALSRMGFAVLFLSNRLSTEAYINLLQKTRSSKILVSGSANLKAASLIQQEYELTCFHVLSREDYDVPSPSGLRFVPTPIPNAENRIAFIIHSSGSTGLPKPIFQTHRACLSNYASGIPYRAFLTLPLYHNHGLSTLFRAICAGHKIALFNANLPLSAGNLIEAMEAVQPESFHSVPYALKLLAETERGIAALQRCKLVLFGGSSCPDDLGDKLVQAGVYLVGHYGATEMGQLMTSFREPGDDAWNYMRPLANAKPYLRFPERSPGIHECVVLDGLPSKVLSNCDDPPNSFETRDTFAPHPTIPDAWKYLGRLDDRVTLVNGEKVLPIPYEHQVRQHELVSEVIVFGVGRSFPGLIIIPSEKAAGLKKEKLLQEIWPTIELANSKAEAFGRISQEMIEILDADVNYPKTDKGTIIRAGFYKQFSKLIEEIYVRFEKAGDDVEKRSFDLEELQEYLLNLLRNKFGFSQIELDTDFFDAGIDSLQSIAIRAQITREVDLNNESLGQNVVYEYPSVKQLAKHLNGVKIGEAEQDDGDVEIMQELINKYSDFPQRQPGTIQPDGETIILTGTTGSLGAHLLSQLVKQSHVKKIYCLVRASSPTTAEERVASTLALKKLPSLSPAEQAKIISLPSDFSKENLGLEDCVLAELQESLTTVIHSAWAVNFNLGVRSFESHHIRGAFNFLNICLDVKTIHPARFYFCSSISAAAGTPLPATIGETLIENLAHAQNMGYAKSKMVTEHIVGAAAAKTGMVARVLRLGQIVGDTTKGVWNTTEAIPLMIQSATTIKALPALNETPSWLPVDAAARAILDISCLSPTSPPVDPTDTSDASTVYHVQNTHLFHWTEDLLPALRAAGLQFETVGQREWVRRLREGEQDPSKNPTIKLIDFFTDKYDNDRPGRAGLVFVTEKTGERSQVIKDGYDVIFSGLMSRCVEYWKTVW